MILSNTFLKNLPKYVSLRYSKNIFKRNIHENKYQEVRNSSNTSQYDVKEVKHHESMAKVWWDSKGPMKALHSMNELRVPFIRNGLVNTHRLSVTTVEMKEKYLTGIEILDVGCGGGILSESLARLGASVTGIDPSEELIKLAHYHANKNTEGFSVPRYIASTVEQHSEEHRYFYDVVVASEVIEHVPNKESFVKGCIKALKPGGSLFFTTPNRTWMSWIGNIIFGEYIFRILPKGTHQYEKFITHSELAAMLEKEGCKVQLVNGMFYDLLRNKWTWTSSTALIYALHAICKKES